MFFCSSIIEREDENMHASRIENFWSAKRVFDHLATIDMENRLDNQLLHRHSDVITAFHA